MEKANVLLRLLMAKKGIKIVKKKNSLFMKILSNILFFNKDFMTKYTTTIGSTIYTPEESLGNMSNELIAHELVHKCDFDTYGNISFAMYYINPQFIGVLTLALSPIIILLSFIYSFNLLYILVLLIFLMPMPSTGRKWLELRGYSATVAVMYWECRFNELDDLNWIIDQFTGPNYYWMWPFKEDIKKELEVILFKIASDQILYEIPILQEIKEIILPGGDT